MSDRENCQVCRKPIHGGDDMVGALKSPFNSFHHWWHLDCFMAEQREKLMQATEAYVMAPTIKAFLRQEWKVRVEPEAADAPEHPNKST